MRRFGGDPSVLGRAITIDGTSYTIVGVLQRAVGPARERDVALHGGALARAEAQGTVLHHGDRAAAPGRVAGGGARTLRPPTGACSRSGSLPTRTTRRRGASCRSEATRRRRRRIDAVRRAGGGRLPAADRVRQRGEPARRARDEPRPRAGDPRRAGRVARTAAAAPDGRDQPCWRSRRRSPASASLSDRSRWSTAYGADYIPRLDEVRLGPVELGWLGLLALGSACCSGLVPAFHSSRLKITARSRQAAGRPATARRRAGLRRVLVAAEFALATPLIVAAVLVAASLDRLGARRRRGLDRSRADCRRLAAVGTLSARSRSRGVLAARARARARTAGRRIGGARRQPSAARGAATSTTSISKIKPALPGQNQPLVHLGRRVARISSATVGLKLETRQAARRALARDDSIVVDRAWADRFFPGQEVIGRRLHEGGCTRVRGRWSSAGRNVSGRASMPRGRTARSITRSSICPDRVLRPAHRGRALVGRRARCARPSPTSIRSWRSPNGARRRPGRRSAVAAALSERADRHVRVAALVLSIVGVYGVMAYFVQQHARDIGIRLALGGEPSQRAAHGRVRACSSSPSAWSPEWGVAAWRPPPRFAALRHQRARSPNFDRRARGPGGGGGRGLPPAGPPRRAPRSGGDPPRELRPGTVSRPFADLTPERGPGVRSAKRP